MKSTLVYSLMMFCCAQPAFAQFQSDEDWQQQAAKQMGAKNVPKQTAAKKGSVQAKQTATRGTNGYSYSAPARHKTSGGYGFRPTRGSIGSGYGYRPQRSDLLPAGYSQEMLQAKMQKLQAMQQMMGGMGGGAMGGGAPMMGGGAPMMGGGGMPMMGGGSPMMGGGMPQQGQQKPNFLQMLMGGGGGGAQQQAQPQQQLGQPQFNRGEMLKSLFSGGGSDMSGQ